MREHILNYNCKDFHEMDIIKGPLQSSETQY